MPDLAALAANWGEVTAAPTLIAARENEVYQVGINGAPVALRLHRAGYQSREAIESELRWTARLAAFGFPCPEPLATVEGALLIALEDGRHASAVTWLEGQALGESAVPFPDASARIESTFHALGALLAQLHNATDAVKTRDLVRPNWGLGGLLGDDPHWGRFWENPTLCAAEAKLLLRARRQAYDRLYAMKHADFGLIHADALQENVLATPTGLALIDFDDAGFGYRAYDLGTAMIQHAAHPRRAAMEAALLAGYVTLRAAPDRGDLRFFTMLRALASCGWVIGRHDDPTYMRSQAERALHCARQWLD